MKEDSLGGACAAAHYSSLDKKDSNMMNMDKAIQISWSSPKINEEHLVHHFTDHRMGGGKIQNMRVNLDDKTAVIEFINDKDVNSVISASPHILIGQKMQVEKMKPKIFGEVDATLSSSCKDYLKKADILEDTLDDVAKMFNIDIRLVNKSYHMVGNLEDVVCAEKSLVELMYPLPINHPLTESVSNKHIRYPVDDRLQDRGSMQFPSSVHNKHVGYSADDELRGQNSRKRTTSFHKHTGYSVEDRLRGHSSMKDLHSSLSKQNGYAMEDASRSYSSMRAPSSAHNKHTVYSGEDVPRELKSPIRETLPAKLDTRSGSEEEGFNANERARSPTETRLNKAFSKQHKHHHDEDKAPVLQSVDDHVSSSHVSSTSSITQPKEKLVKMESGDQIEPETVMVDPSMWEFIEKFEEYSLREIGKTYGVYLKKYSLAADLLEISVVAQSSTSKVTEAEIKLSSLYNGIYEQNVLESCHIPHYLDKNVVKQAKREVQGLFYNVLIKENPGGNSISIIGKRDIAIDARKHLQHFVEPQRHHRGDHHRGDHRGRPTGRQRGGGGRGGGRGQPPRTGTRGNLVQEYKVNMEGLNKYTENVEQGQDALDMEDEPLQLDENKIDTGEEKDAHSETDFSQFKSEGTPHVTDSNSVAFVPTECSRETISGVGTPPPPLEDASDDDYSNAGQKPSTSSTLHIAEFNISHTANNKNEISLRDEERDFHSEGDNLNDNTTHRIKSGRAIQDNYNHTPDLLGDYSASDMKEIKQVMHAEMESTKPECTTGGDNDSPMTKPFTHHENEHLFKGLDPFDPEDERETYLCKPSIKTEDSSASIEVLSDPKSPLVDIDFDMPPESRSGVVSLPGNLHTERIHPQPLVSLEHESDSQSSSINTSHQSQITNTGCSNVEGEGDDDRHVKYDDNYSAVSDYGNEDNITKETRSLPQPENGHMDFLMTDETGKLKSGILKITFKIPKVQSNPEDMTYPETRIQTCLPHNRRGKDIMQLLQLAFSRKILFIGIPETKSGMYHYKIVPNNVSIQQKSGFSPDENYLEKLELELAELGVSKVDLENERATLEEKYGIKDT